MKKTLVLKSIDYLFLFSILLLSSFIIFNYFFKSRLLCFLVSFVFSYLLYKGIIYLLNKRNINILSKKQDQKNIAALRLSLITSGTKNAIKYLEIAFNGKNNGNIIENEKEIFFINLQKSELDIYDFEKLKKSLLIKDKEKIIITEKVSDEVNNLLANIDVKVKIFDFADVYFHFIKDKCDLPTPAFVEKNPTKNTFKSLAKIAFAKPKAKGYFINGIIIFIFSFLYPFRNYYIICSLVLFIMALTCLFEPFKNY